MTEIEGEVVNGKKTVAKINLMSKAVEERAEDVA